MSLKLEMSEQTRAFMDFLQSEKPKEFTYDQARNITGLNDLSRLRGSIYTCLRRLKADGIWYRVNRGIGYRLAGESEKVKIQDKRLNGMGRRTGKIAKDHDTIKLSILSRDQKLEYTFVSARIGLATQAFSRRVAKEIRREIANGKLPIEGI